MSEHGTYLMVKSALEQAEEFVFLLKWYSDGWKMETPKGTVTGVTANELHQWLNGYRAGGALGSTNEVNRLKQELAKLRTTAPQDKLKGIRTFTDAAIAAEIAAENGLDTAEAKHLWERYQEALNDCAAQSGTAHKDILQDARDRCMEAGKCIARGEHTNVEDLILGAVDMVIEYLETHGVPESPASPPHVWIGFAPGVNNVTRAVACKTTPEEGEFFKGPFRVESIPESQAAKVDTGDCSTCAYLFAPGRCRLGNDTKRSQCRFHTGVEKK